MKARARTRGPDGATVEAVVLPAVWGMFLRCMEHYADIHVLDVKRNPSEGTLLVTLRSDRFPVDAEGQRVHAVIEWGDKRGYLRALRTVEGREWVLTGGCW